MSFSFFAPTSFFESTSNDGRARGGRATHELTRPFPAPHPPLPEPYYLKNDNTAFSYEPSFVWDAQGCGAPEWMNPGVFPVPSYAGGRLLTGGPAFGSELIGTTSPTSSLSSLVPVDSDFTQGLVDDPERESSYQRIQELPENETEAEADENVIALATSLVRPKRKCVVASVVESDESPPKKKTKGKVKTEPDPEDSDGGSVFELNVVEQAEKGGPVRTRGKKTAKERRERRKATNRASQYIPFTPPLARDRTTDTTWTRTYRRQGIPSPPKEPARRHPGADHRTRSVASRPHLNHNLILTLTFFLANPLSTDEEISNLRSLIGNLRQERDAMPKLSV